MLTKELLQTTNNLLHCTKQIEMEYTEPKDKADIKKAFTVLCIEHDTNLSAFCRKYGYDYHDIYQKMTRYTISHNLVNEMVAKLDPKRKLQRINGTLKISLVL